MGLMPPSFALKNGFCLIFLRIAHHKKVKYKIKQKLKYKQSLEHAQYCGCTGCPRGLGGTPGCVTWALGPASSRWQCRCSLLGLSPPPRWPLSATARQGHGPPWTSPSAAPGSFCPPAQLLCHLLPPAPQLGQQQLDGTQSHCLAASEVPATWPKGGRVLPHVLLSAIGAVESQSTGEGSQRLPGPLAGARAKKTCCPRSRSS